MITAITAVILAGGASRRMGRAKQLLPLADTTLIGHVCECAVASKCDNVIALLGAGGEKIKENISSYPLTVVNNPDWPEGIASSIKTAVRHILSRSERVDALLFLTCDQVAISTDLLNRMIDTFNDSSQSIVACSYGDTHGIPALFPRRLFNDLLALSGDKGAKSILITHRKEIISIPFPGGEIDIDNRKDYQSLQSGSAGAYKTFPIHNREIRPACISVAKESHNETT